MTLLQDAPARRRPSSAFLTCSFSLFLIFRQAFGNGVVCRDAFESLVNYHDNSPKLNERVLVLLPEAFEVRAAATLCQPKN